MNIGTSLTKADYQKLEASFITKELAQQAMIKRVSSTQGRELIGRKDRGNYSGIIFPYIWPSESSIREYRLRRDSPDMERQTDGTTKEKAKYLTPPGRGSMFYFVPGTPIGWLQDIHLPIALTEGEKKTIALYRLAMHESDKPRFLPLGIPGVWNWRGTIGKEPDETGQRVDVKGAIKDFERLPLEGREVFIIFDANVYTNSSVRQARAQLAEELKTRRAIVKYVDLPRIEGCNGVDDVLAIQGTDYVLNIIKNSRPAIIKIDEGFKVSDSGVYAVDKTGEKADLWICDRLDVVAAARNADSEGWAQLLEFSDRDGKPHSQLLPMSMLLEPKEYLRLLYDSGLKITTNTQARGLLGSYIQMANPEKRLRTVNKIGWHNEVYVMPDETFGEQKDEKFFLDFDSSHLLKKSGTLEQWQQNIARLCAGNSRLVFAISAAFAPPLMRLANEQGGGFHYRGASSSGKSTALMAAGSVWGGGPRTGYIETWRATANGMESIAETHNCGLLCLDEIGQCDPKEVGDIAYTLANGSGKLRMTKAIGTRKKLEWEILFLSNGELSLAHHVEASGKRTRAGQEIRLCDIESDAGKDMGIFENLHDYALPSQLALHLTTASAKYYGTPIRAFLARLVNQQPRAEDHARKMRQWFIENHVPDKASGEIYRAASRFALVASAGEQARVITGWRANEATEAAVKLFKVWLSNRGTVGSSEHEAAIKQVRAFIQTHGSSRFQNAENDQRTIINRAGFRRENDAQESEYLVLTETFQKEVCQGFDYKYVAEELSKRGFLIRDKNDNRLAIQARMPEIGKARFYCLTSKLMEADN
jgi:putative DNA primase/helicase